MRSAMRGRDAGQMLQAGVPAKCGRGTRKKIAASRMLSMLAAIRKRRKYTARWECLIAPLALRPKALPQQGARHVQGPEGKDRSGCRSQA